MRYKKYTDQDIINNAKNVKSISGLLKSIGLKAVGGNYINIKRNLQRLNIDTSHWTGYAWNKDKQLKDYSQYTRSSNLKHHLLKERGHFCNSCKLSIWQNKNIPLELHHLDGDRANNNKENLEFLCPNCHAITDNWRGRNK